MKHFIGIILLLVIASACKEVYETPPQSFFKASFINSATKKSISPKVSVLGVGLDSLFYKDETLSVVQLPLSNDNETTFVFSLDSIVDIIQIKHENELQYGSMESGFYYNYLLKEINFTHNRIDSIQISDSLVTKTWHENIKLYIRPLSANSN